MPSSSRGMTAPTSRPRTAAIVPDATSASTADQGFTVSWSSVTSTAYTAATNAPSPTVEVSLPR